MLVLNTIFKSRYYFVSPNPKVDLTKSFRQGSELIDSIQLKIVTLKNNTNIGKWSKAKDQRPDLKIHSSQIIQ